MMNEIKREVEGLDFERGLKSKSQSFERTFKETVGVLPW